MDKAEVELAIANERVKTDAKLQRLEDQIHETQKEQSAQAQKLTDISHSVDNIHSAQGNIWSNIKTLSADVEQLKESSRWVKEHLQATIEEARRTGAVVFGRTARDRFLVGGTGLGGIYFLVDAVLPHILPIISALGG